MTPIDRVPRDRAQDPGRGLVPNLDATARDLRWDRNSGRAVIGVLLVELLAGLWLFGAWLFGDSTTPSLVVGAVTFAWMLSGLFHLGIRSTAMGPRMATAVRGGLDTWRALPDPARRRAEPVARALIAAGARHDVDGVRVRLDALDRLALLVATQDPGMRDDVDELTAWTDATEEIHRDH